MTYSKKLSNGAELYLSEKDVDGDIEIIFTKYGEDYNAYLSQSEIREIIAHLKYQLKQP